MTDYGTPSNVDCALAVIPVLDWRQDGRRRAPLLNGSDMEGIQRRCAEFEPRWVTGCLMKEPHRILYVLIGLSVRFRIQWDSMFSNFCVYAGHIFIRPGKHVAIFWMKIWH
ncbi:uncharacterized protein LOC141627389 [Silene latifolia]|uniref:uncharacterized protein LOC141627389 n=1 Tax=Silene latifolia TaxID=37657 RepID=UPI003D775098